MDWTISIHSLHTEGDPYSLSGWHAADGFQSTPSTRRETVRQPLRYIPAAISIHSLHTEGDVVGTG